MTARPLTDAQIARALRLHLPERAQAGLESRIFAAASSTPQQRNLPAIVAGLWDADPSSRRRYQLLAAALLVALTLAVVAGVGALLRFPEAGTGGPLSRSTDRRPGRRRRRL